MEFGRKAGYMGLQTHLTEGKSMEFDKNSIDTGTPPELRDMNAYRGKPRGLLLHVLAVTAGVVGTIVFLVLIAVLETNVYFLVGAGICFLVVLSGLTYLGRAKKLLKLVHGGERTIAELTRQLNFKSKTECLTTLRRMISQGALAGFELRGGAVLIPVEDGYNANSTVSETREDKITTENESIKEESNYESIDNQ